MRTLDPDTSPVHIKTKQKTERRAGGRASEDSHRHTGSSFIFEQQSTDSTSKQEEPIQLPQNKKAQAPLLDLGDSSTV